MKKPKNSWHFLENLFGLLGFILVALWGNLLLVTTVLFFFKNSISNLNIVVASVLTLVVSIYFTKKLAITKPIQTFLSSILVLTLVIFGSVFIASKFYDLSYDGQAYHQEAILQLSRGWNPVYTTLTDQATANLERWLNHYPKGTWIPATSLFIATNNIESGKALTFIALAAALFFGAWGLWRVSIPLYAKMLGGLVLIFNPVVVYQLLSYYIDGILVSLLLALAFVCVRIYIDKRSLLALPLFYLLIVLVNIKLTSLIFAGIVMVYFLGHLWLNNKLYASLRIFKITAVAFTIGTLFVGFNPYITNMATKGHPLYPAMGKGALDYVEGNTPENYWRIASPFRLIHSIFSTSSLARGKGQSGNLKIPFTVGDKELEPFRETNAKVGGFGPLFGGAVLIAIITAIFVSNKKIAFSIALAIIVSAGLVATSSVARFVPFVWWVPGAIALIALGSQRILPKILGFTVVLVLIINTLLIARESYAYSLSQNQKLTDQLNKLAHENMGREPILVSVGQFGSVKVKLRRYGINYKEIDSVSCKSSKQFLANNIAKICQL